MCSSTRAGHTRCPAKGTLQAQQGAHGLDSWREALTPLGWVGRPQMASAYRHAPSGR